MTSSPGISLIRDFRQRLLDSKPSIVALTLACTDSAVTAFTVEVFDRRLVLTPTGGTVRPLDLDLSKYPYDTIGGLYQTLSRHTGLAVQRGDGQEEHLSSDLSEFGPVDVQAESSGVTLKHHYFSDYDLEKFIAQAIGRHNPSLRVNQIPPNEVELVMALANANALRQKANDAARNKGTETDVQNLLSLAQSYETAYKEDLQRLSRAVRPVPESKSGTIGSGDIIVGTFSKVSLRMGYEAPVASALPPEAPSLLPPEQGDEADTSIRVRWLRTSDPGTYRYELWIDTQAEVQRYMESERPTTSKVAYKGFSPVTNVSREPFTTYIESFEHGTTRFVIPTLEPESDYYVRIYIVDKNSQVVASEVRKFRTKELRARFDRTRDPSANATVGDTVTVRFDAAYGAVTSAHKFWVGGKLVTLTVVSGTEATFVVPAFTQKALPKDLTVESPTGLKDILPDFLLVT